MNFRPLAKSLYRRSIRFRAKFNMVPALFTSKEMMLNEAMAFVARNKVRGDYLEFGTYEGNSFISAYHFSKSCAAAGMKYYAFDSFRGLPELAPEDRDPQEDLQFAPGDYVCGEEAFKKNLRAGGVHLDETILVAGYFEDTLAEDLKRRLPLVSAAVVLVDCDLHSSAAAVLDFIVGYVVDGTVLIFDDWFHFKGDPERGEQKAFAEWLKKNSRMRAYPFRSYSWHGQSYILRKASDA